MGGEVMDRSYFEKIIEREFRKAVNDSTSPVHVDMSEDELIVVTYRCATYSCDCDSDEDFEFVRQDGMFTIRFPIPDDYLI